ncbi:MAG: carbohydrate-binding family 9-like protein [Melioribacteraceae bacterium]
MKYLVKKIDDNLKTSIDEMQFSEIESIHINNYLWMNNNYNPNVEAKVCYSAKNIFVYFKVYEKEITATYTNINDPVYKNSCVEFFVNLFPEMTDKYFNFEMNAIGTIYVGFGAIGKRKILPIEDIKLVKVFSTLTKPFVGQIENDFWEIKLSIPINLLEKYYKQKFESNPAIANFYKCGDATKYEHYGCWNLINSEKPNFHLPKYFGDLLFE